MADGGDVRSVTCGRFVGFRIGVVEVSRKVVVVGSQRNSLLPLGGRRQFFFATATAAVLGFRALRA